MMFGTAVGPASAAETPVDIIMRVCGNYVPVPTPDTRTTCSGKDLSGADLTGANLTTDLTDANLTGANLQVRGFVGFTDREAIAAGYSTHLSFRN